MSVPLPLFSRNQGEIQKAHVELRRAEDAARALVRNALRTLDCQRAERMVRINQGDRGLEDVVRAMGQLRDFDIELHVRGSWQAGYLERFLSTAAAAGVSRDRIVSHEPAAPDEMVRLASAYDIGLALERPVALNNDILLSNKVFTYLLAGLAVVATRTRAQAALACTLAGSLRRVRRGAPEERGVPSRCRAAQSRRGPSVQPGEPDLWLGGYRE